MDPLAIVLKNRLHNVHSVYPTRICCIDWRLLAATVITISHVSIEVIWLYLLKQLMASDGEKIVRTKIMIGN